VDPTVATEYLPRIGTLDHNGAGSLMGTDDNLQQQQSAAVKALQQRTPPDRTLVERVLDGLRRL
jgi:hypothetical protein